ncbi:MarR family transcriptional regulator [Bacteroides sp. K03]|uniref:MarR family winged helix-turn-helix transcriptional regulator n=1 Tax=Bacteroides sp. K03 TaxID=2718928 RepID=UPI001C8B8DC5|nr:MarR family transcriptional regulator [Bacteroides sp. K03]MBX9188295.1 MarR family transcriptional regulator [Bacteroides sp. K03]
MANSEPARELILQMLHTRMAFRQTIQRVLKADNIDMTFEMLQVMHCLWKNQGISQQSLAEQTAKDKACLTNLINNLEKKGWVIRREDPEDKRSRLVYLTESGEKLAQRVNPLTKGVYKEIEQHISEKQIQSCLAGMNKITEILNKI